MSEPGRGLRVEHLDVWRGTRATLRSLSFFAPAGKVTVLVGENGAGKSTVLDAIVGLLPLGAGRVCLHGADLAGVDRRTRAQQIASCGQVIPGPWDHTALARIAQGLVPRHGVSRLVDRTTRAAVLSVSAELALQDLLSRPLHALSGGERRRVHVARALVDAEADVYALDEPFAGVDLRHRDAIARSLRRRAAEGRVVIVSVHELDWVFRLADRVVALRGGVRVAEGTPEEVLCDETLFPVFGVHGRLVEVERGQRALLLERPPEQRVPD